MFSGEEVENDCAHEQVWSCQQTEKRGGGTTDDVICECDGDGTTLAAPCADPAPVPAPPPPRTPSMASASVSQLIGGSGTTNLPIVLITTPNSRRILDGSYETDLFWSEIHRFWSFMD